MMTQQRLKAIKQSVNAVELWLKEAEPEAYETANPFLSSNIGFALAEIKELKALLPEDIE